MSLGQGAFWFKFILGYKKKVFPRAVSDGWKKSKESKNTLDGRRKKYHKVGGNKEEWAERLEYSQASYDDNFIDVYSGLSTLLMLKAGYQLCD